MKDETRPKISPHLWYTDKADEAAAFYASKVEAGKLILAVSMSGRVLINVDRKHVRPAAHQGGTTLLRPYEALESVDHEHQESAQSLSR